MRKLILFLLLKLSLISYSQTSFNSENYNVTKADLEINTYDKDSTANALVLYEYGNSFFDKHDYILKTEEKHKVKILNREGFDKADISIYLYNNEKRKEKIKNILATTYNLIDGKIITTKLQKSNIFEEKYNDNYTITKFTLPNIKEGSVITYSYTIESPFMFKYKGWYFQDDIPKLYSEYRASIPGNYDYNIKLVGGKKLFINKQEVKRKCLSAFNGAYADCVNSIYAMKNIPAFIEEDYMTAEQNYLARIEYELKTFKDFDGGTHHYTKTWKTVDKELKTDKDIGRQLNKTINVDNFISSTIINESDKLKKAKSIYKHVQENYTWNEEYKIFKDVSVKDLIKNKSGNVSSINILLHNLLKESGINVKPILLSTRNNGFATKIYPVLSDFNYLIVEANINGTLYLLDATDKYLPFGNIPYRCLNGYGRLLDFKNGSQWIDIAPSKTSTIQYKSDLKIDENQIISGKVSNKTTGYHALNSKKRYYRNTDSYIDNLQNEQPNIEISNHKVLSAGKTSSDFIESYDIEYNDDLSGDNIYLNPFFVKFFKENPFKLQERTYPIDFGYKDTYYYILKLSFNEETYSILEKPNNVNLVLPNKKGNIVFSSTVNNNFIQLMFKISFNDTIYAPEYYPYLKEFMSKVVDIQNNTLILLKKN